MIRTLIVEDDYHVATIHTAYVRRVDGYVVTGHCSTFTGARGVMDGDDPPDLVLLDLFLPDGNGLDLLREGWSDPETRPDFLVITAARDMQSVRAALRLGAVHYLVKPFDFAQMEERLRAYGAMRQRLGRIQDAEHEAQQHEVDALYGLLGRSVTPPKGQSALTANLIRDLMRAEPDDLSASEIADRVGISRSTAQRYLVELARQGVLELRPHYGATGRPEHRYRAVSG